MPYTIPSTPPVKELSQKRSRWTELFQECRDHPNEWRRLTEPMRRASAAQIASDIRNAHLRDFSKVRIRGFLPDDKWDAAWGTDPNDTDPTHFYVWLRYLGPLHQSSSGGAAA